jgi:hypothetical protein
VIAVLEASDACGSDEGVHVDRELEITRKMKMIRSRATSYAHVVVI